MAITVGKTVIFTALMPTPQSLDLPRFQTLARAHMKNVPRTAAVEAKAAALLRGAFMPDAALEEFVREVCGWGSYAGIAGRILKRNTPAAIRACLQAGHAQTTASPPDPAAALRAVNGIKGIGRPSFASKHLRFLCPAVCPVLDSIISGRMSYAFDASGYAAFAGDCATIAAALKKAKVPNPWSRPAGAWYAADVEGALFAHLNGWA